jgi:hypothetical protein
MKRVGNRPGASPSWPDSRKLLTRVRLLADWFVQNQVTDGADANRGRFIDHVPAGRPAGRPLYATNWTIGMTIISLTMAWRRTRDRKYLDSAWLAGAYLKSLQVLDRTKPWAFGGFREETPQTEVFHPRDALSAAWGLLHLHMVSGAQAELYRVRLFAEWFRRHAMRNGYPAWTAYVTPKRAPYWQRGSFHGGSPLFFFDLFDVTGEAKWRRLGLTICDTWIRTFPRPDGSIRIEVDPQSGKDLTGTGPNKGHLGWQDMHKLNDDFTTQALLRAYRLTGRQRYLDAARRFLDWVLSVQNPDGSFGKVPVNSAAPTLILELLDFARIAGAPECRAAAARSVPHFLQLQETRLRDRRFLGGVYCIHGPYIHNSRVNLGVRTSAYALAALLRLESSRRYAGYTA